MDIEKRLSALGLELPAPPTPAGNYVGSVRVDNLLFVGGNVGRLNAEPLKYTGKVGGEVTLEQAYEMARRCALNHLAAIKAALGDLDRVERVVKVTGYVNAAPGFNEMPKVINGESDLLVELWGEQGRHARAAGLSPTDLSVAWSLGASQHFLPHADSQDGERASGQGTKARGAGLSRPGPDQPSERSEEVEQILLLVLVEPVELVDHGIGLRRTELAVAIASMGLDRLDEVVRTAVVEEEDALAEAPQR